MKHDKVIFLDIDGVLNCDYDFTADGRKQDPVHSKLQKGEKWKIVNKTMLSLLNDLINQTGAKIVFSSTWRTVCDAKKMQKIFKRYGDTWTQDLSVWVGETGKSYTRFSENPMNKRLQEIDYYLQINDVAKYVIIDDADLEYQYKKLPDPIVDMNNFIYTDEVIGLLQDHVDICTRILNE